ncbi:MAG: alpha/beta hydrolase [Chloracidobacterium sp.]|nr:alpha/beta hydrolase [Chloracidobacterium sp.]
MSFEHADVGGLKLHYAIAGSGQKLVILLHGFPEFWYSWRHQLIALSDEYTVVAPDMRGYNLSDRPPHAEDYSIDKLVGDVVGLIRHFGVEKAAVIGHDWGAAVAWALAIQHPEVVWKLGALQVPPLPIWKRKSNIQAICCELVYAFLSIARITRIYFQTQQLQRFGQGLTRYDGPARDIRRRRDRRISEGLEQDRRDDGDAQLLSGGQCLQSNVWQNGSIA